MLCRSTIYRPSHDQATKRIYMKLDVPRNVWLPGHHLRIANSDHRTVRDVEKVDESQFLQKLSQSVSSKQQV